MSEKSEEWEPVMMSLSESYTMDCRHIKQLLNSTSFEGTGEQRASLLNRVIELEGELTSISLDKMRENYKNKKTIFPDWNRKYSMIKLAVYKACGYTVRNEKIENIFR